MSDKSKGIIKDIIVFAAVSVFVIALDQITKAAVYKNIQYGSSVVLIPGLLEISHVHNTGAAWGFMSSHTGILSAVTAVTCIFLAFLFFQGRKVLFKVSMAMVITGAVGNLIDRVFRGFVIDFIRVWIFKYEFPNFNVADSSITIGCVLLVISVLASGKSDDSVFRGDSLIVRLMSKGRKKEHPEDAENDG